MLPSPAATCTGGVFFSTKQAFTNVCTYKWAHIVTCTVWWWLYVVVIYVLCRCMAFEYQLWNWLKPPNAVKRDLATLLPVWSLRYRDLAESSLAKSHFTVFCSPLHESLCISSGDSLTSSEFQGLQTNKWLLGAYIWTLLAQCCWCGVVFSEKAFQHSGSPTQRCKLSTMVSCPFFDNM